MAPLSIIPGRVRYETPLLIRQQQLCRHFERKIMAIDEVLEVSASHRTGRILVKFDENRIARHDLTAQIEKALIKSEGVEDIPVESDCLPKSKRTDQQKGNTSHLLLDAVAHAILPKPFDILVPAAVSVFRR